MAVAPANTLYLRQGADRRLRRGHLWIYSNEVDQQRSPITGFTVGETVAVCGQDGQLFGAAYVDPQALICARLYAPGTLRPFDEALVSERLQAALALRERFFDEPCYRLVYGDSDLLPGIVVDRFGDHLVLQLNQAGLERHLDEIRNALVAVLSPRGLLLRGDSRERLSRGLQPRLEVLHGSVPDWVAMSENGVRFEAPVHQGQKTGWFYDHRPSRARLAAYCDRARVLDVYSYIGGWGVQAAAFGADQVTCVDSSASALEGVARNARLNDCESRVSTLAGPADRVMAELQGRGERFDVVVLDPPAFIPRRRDLGKGRKAYARINGLALGLLNEGGVLVSASCSMHLPRTDFIAALQAGASRADTGLRILEQGGQGLDHPIHPAIPETEYLKTAFCLSVPRAG
jgi:23S rRNA (cytosine1962-C5)-methyltransferase